MKRILLASTALLASAGIAGAVGLDRSNQDITPIFEDGNYAQLSFGKVRPDVSGTGYESAQSLGFLPDFSYQDVADGYTQLGASVKVDVNPQLSFALIFDQPYGANVSYSGDPATTLLGGTSADLDSRALTAIGRYRINDAFSVHAGLRRQELEADITLSGLAYAGISGYNVKLDDGSGHGWLVGAAYERPDIALRIALTYFSEVENDFDTVESLNGAPLGTGTTTVSAPESINLDVQTGIAQDTLLFGQLRYAKYSQTILTPDVFGTLTGGASITDLEDNYGVTLGVGRRLTDNFSASVSVGYDNKGEDDLVSPLAPTDGRYSIQIGGEYTLDQIVLGGGVRYAWLGDAQPETGTPDVARADFSDNDALAVGLSVGFRF